MLTVRSKLDYRHRDPDGLIAQKHGSTLIRTLRRLYGKSFAPGFQESEMLSQVLQKIDQPSLSAILRDEELGKLTTKVARARLGAWTPTDLFENEVNMGTDCGAHSDLLATLRNTKSRASLRPQR
jgi:hypothetical protein